MMEYYNTAALVDEQNGLADQAYSQSDQLPADHLGHVNPYYEDDGENPAESYELQDQGPYMQQPGRHGHMRPVSMASSASYHSDEDDADDVLEEEAVAAALRDPHSVLDLLPSRQLGTTLAAASGSHSNKWLRHRKSTKSTMSIKRGRGSSGTKLAVERMMHNDNMTGRSAMATIRRQNTIKGIPSSLETKRKIRDKVERRGRKEKKDKSLGCFTLIMYNIGMGWQRLKNSIKDFIYSINFWGDHIKKIEGNFGSGVTSYFTFLRWLLLLNIPVFLLSFCFTTIPQLIYEPSPQYNTQSFSGWDLLTGMGWFTDTELYYGYYTNETFSVVHSHYYNMPVAYLFACGGYSLFILIAVLFSMSKAYRQYYVVGRGDYNFHVTKVFCSWDYNITAKKSAKLKQKSIYLELAEQLSSQKAKKEYSGCQRFGIWIGRLCTNILVLALIGGACAGVVFGYTENIDTNLENTTVSVLIMPLIICGLNLLLPPVFSIISNYERYRSPRVKLYITMARTILLKAALLVVMIHFWFDRSKCDPVGDDHNETTTAPNGGNKTRDEDCVDCWETEFGQELYRLVIIDFVLLLLTVLFVEFLRRILSDYCCKKLNKPEFDIARNTMELIQAQALTWLGMFYSPLLVIICMLKLVLLFYVKRFSVLANCTPSLVPWRAGRTTTVFIGMLLTMFFITAGAVGYGIISIPSSNDCGPFRHLTYVYDVVFVLLNDWADSDTLNWIYTIIDIILSPGTVLIFMLCLSLGVYYYKAISGGGSEQIKKLRFQISVEGKDKMFLLKMLQDRVKQLPRDQQRQYKASLTKAQMGADMNGSAMSTHRLEQTSTADIETWIDDEANQHSRQS